MQSKKNFIRGAIFGVVIVVIYFILNLDKVSFVEAVGISIVVGLILGLLSLGVSKLMNKKVKTKV